jgi:hypothetical protein
MRRTPVLTNCGEIDGPDFDFVQPPIPLNLAHG